MAPIKPKRRAIPARRKQGVFVDAFDHMHSVSARRLEGFRSVFQKVCRILSGRPIKMKLVKGTSGPLEYAVGWTDGETIFLNAALIDKTYVNIVGNGATTASPNMGDSHSRNLALRFMASLKGVVYHELSHCLHTPRMDSDVVRELRQRNATEQGTWFAWNLLEDQRIELLFWSTYRSSKPYFQLMTLQWVMDNKDALEHMHAFLHGRRYLPQKLREDARIAYTNQHGQALADEAAAIIDEFALIDYSDPDLVYELVERFRKVLGQMQQNSSQDMPSQTSANHDNPSGGSCKFSKGQPESSGDAQENAEQMREQIDAEEQHDDNDGDGQDGKPSVSAFGKNKGKGKGDKAKSQKSKEVQEGQAGDGDDSLSGGDGAGTVPEGSAPPEASKGAWEDALNDALDDALNDGALIDDVKKTFDQVRNFTNGEHVIDMQVTQHQPYDASSAMRNAVKGTTDNLRQLHSALEPDWFRDEPNGRMNVDTVMRSRHNPTNLNVFDRWEEGSEEEAGLEMVLLLDLSTSMRDNGNASRSQQALWVIKRTMDAIDMPCTVLGFAHGRSLLYTAHEHADPSKYRRFDDLYPATEPKSALVDAANIFQQSEQKNKVLVMLTDGQWGETQQCETLISNIGGTGVVTCLFGLGGAVSRYGNHNCMIAHDVSGPEHVARFVQSVVMGIEQNARLNG